MPVDFESLSNLAREASKRAYCKFSNFAVGAALQAADGRVFTGCNVENSSYGLSMCAERVALFRAVAAGATEFTAVAIYTPTSTPVPPCGACRQVLGEFMDDMPIRMTCEQGTADGTLAELLPLRFRLPE